MATSKMSNNVKNKQSKTFDYEHAVYAIALAVASYTLGTMAIDNGSLIFYGLAIVALYWSVHFAKLFVRQTFKK